MVINGTNKVNGRYLSFKDMIQSPYKIDYCFQHFSSVLWIAISREFVDPKVYKLLLHMRIKHKKSIAY